MTNAKHTPEPWIISDMGFPHQPTIRPVATDMAYIAKVNAGRSEYQENVRRICAAVNACQGIGTEALEQGVVRQLVEALEDFYNWLTPDWKQSSLGDKAHAAIAKATGSAV